MNNTEARDTAKAWYGSSLVEIARALSEVRKGLTDYETSALADVAATLADAAEKKPSVDGSRAEGRELYDEWVDAEQAAAYLKRTPKTFRNIVGAGEYSQ